MVNSPTPKWDPIGFDPLPNGFLRDTVDGCEIHFAPPKKPWNDDSPGFKVVRNGFPRFLKRLWNPLFVHLLIFTGESSFQGFLGGAKWISQPSVSQSESSGSIHRARGSDGQLGDLHIDEVSAGGLTLTGSNSKSTTQSIPRASCCK